MPELPEVETVVRSLRRMLCGVRVESVRCYFPAVVDGDADRFVRTLTGGTFAGFGRHGKHIFLRVDGGGELSLHLRMTGQLFLADRSRPPDKHTHVEIFLADSGRKLVYRDVRKFGRFVVLDGGVESFVRRKGLGPDALTVSPSQLVQAFAGTRRCVKAALMDQTVVAGLGNIYTDELLYLTGVAPLRRASSLTDQRCRDLCDNMHQLLSAAIASRGTTISDYVNLEGEQGEFRGSLRVYGRSGQACSRCGAAIERVVVGGRGTWYCPGCQF